MKALLALVCAAALTAAGCGGSDEQAAAPPPALADLTVTLDRDGDGAQPARTTSVRCASPSDSAACRAVMRMEADSFQPVAGNVACTELYGGPETATVKGTLRGEAIDARFSRVNGCEIARWERAARLLEAGG